MEYSIIVGKIDNYNNIYDMKNKFNNLLKNYDNDELEQFKKEILVEIENHKKECIDIEDCDTLNRYNYAIKKIDITITKNNQAAQIQQNKFININSNNYNSNINSNNSTNEIKKENKISKYWWGLIIPVIVGLIIWYLTK